MKIDVYVICKNEIKLAPFYVDYWKALAEDVDVYVYDGNSTDGTRELLGKYDWIHIINKVPAELDDYVHKDIKNNAWKQSKGKADFVMVADFDETIFSYSVDELRESLQKMKDGGYTILAPLSFNIIADNFPAYQEGKYLHELCEYGENEFQCYSKPILFDPNQIEEMCYVEGAHCAYPSGNVKWYNPEDLFLIHSKYIGVEYHVDRIKTRVLSEANKKGGLFGEKDKSTYDLVNDYVQKKNKRFKWSDVKDNFYKHYRIRNNWTAWNWYAMKLMKQPYRVTYVEKEGEKKDVKVGLFCVASTENKYIREWVEHYYKLGFSQIVICDNNPKDGERFEDVIMDYLNSGFVKLMNVRGVNFEGMQGRLYEQMYFNFRAEFDWLCFFDCDEFLVLNKDKNISEYLSRDCFKEFDSIHVNWKIFDDNDLVYYEDKPVMERFTRPANPNVTLNGQWLENEHVKSFIRGDIDMHLRFLNPHVSIDVPNCCNDNGERLEGPAMPYNKCDYTLAQLNHYQLRTIEEYITVKRKRGYPDKPFQEALQQMPVDRFWLLNKKTEEKLNYLKQLYDNDNIKTYITYFDDRQIDDFGLKATDNTVLFKANDTSITGDSINNLNLFYCELTTLYWVWKNTDDKVVCFKQYRRPFETDIMPKVGEVVTYDKYQLGATVEQQYCNCHSPRRNKEIVEYLTNKFGKDSKYLRYWKYCNYMYTNNTFIMNREDFNKMCEFVFGVLFDLDKKWKLNKDYDKYLNNARHFVDDGRNNYQEHFMSYIGERLVSAYIAMDMKPIHIPRLTNNGFYEPYKPKTSK